MSKKDHKKKSPHPLGGGIGTSHFLRTGSGFHSPRKYGKKDRRNGKNLSKED